MFGAIVAGLRGRIDPAAKRESLTELEPRLSLSAQPAYKAGHLSARRRPY
jgi:hypothetical protein